CTIYHAEFGNEASFSHHLANTCKPVDAPPPLAERGQYAMRCRPCKRNMSDPWTAVYHLVIQHGIADLIRPNNSIESYRMSQSFELEDASNPTIAVQFYRALK
ncbi:hypothetical protein PFISCL1PPCAC_16141, partial [Pristionchus fissidentatus]